MQILGLYYGATIIAWQIYVNENLEYSFLNFQLFSFCPLVPTVAVDSCFWLKRVETSVFFLHLKLFCLEI